MCNRHMDAMRTTQDGNYHMSGGGKDTDEDDKALSENAGVFVHQGDWAKVLEHASKSKCKDKEVHSSVLVSTLANAGHLANDLFQLRSYELRQVQRQGLRHRRCPVPPRVCTARRRHRFEQRGEVSYVPILG